MWKRIIGHLSVLKQIAKAVLEVLVYLQSADPPVIHRDIKPDNILVNRQEKKVYLVDFGFARIGGGEVAVSSVVKGTLGFMPPEQMFNRQLTEASDLYSLGVTLVCLLTQTKSSEIGNLIDSAYRINVKRLIPSLNQEFVDWLQKMVAPELKNRFDNAAPALNALQPIDVVGNTPTPNKQVFTRKLSPVAMAVVLAALCLIAILGTTKIISIISHSGDHHRTEKHDKKKKHHYDRDDDEKKDQSDKGDDQDQDDDDD